MSRFVWKGNDYRVGWSGRVKATFYNLEEDKRRRIEAAALEEFSVHGYERGSTDRIIRGSGISKGGLYEYIDSKEDLFLHVVSQAFGALYDHIHSALRAAGGPPADILERVRSSSRAALEFYLSNPPIVRLLAHLAALGDPDTRAAADRIASLRFHELFDNADFASVRLPPDRVLGLLKWILVKTRNDFISEAERSEDRDEIARAYLADWDFMLSVLKDGIYSERGTRCSD